MSIKLFCDQCQSEIDTHGNRYSLSTNFSALDFDKRECITDWFAANPEIPEQTPDPQDPPADDPPAEDPPADDPPQGDSGDSGDAGDPEA